MAERPVHWFEGLFLRPHQLQAQDRHLRDDVVTNIQWTVGYWYGLRVLDLDEDALSNWRISVRRCQARLRDGTLVRFPEHALLPPLDLPRALFKRPDDRVRIYLAVPRLQLGRQNSDLTPDSACRYVVESQEIEDENLVGNPQTVETRWMNARLFAGETEQPGYELLPIVQLKLGAVAEAPPTIDTDYIPPLLACDAWPYLQERILSSVYDRFGSLADQFARVMNDRGVAFESGHREDLERIFKLNAVNTALGSLWNLPRAQGVHPFLAYSELCRIVGMIAIFFPKRTMPDIPVYDHDDLGKCFHAVKRWLYPDDVPDQTYVKRPFIGAGLQMQVRIEREWLGAGWSFYLGVESPLKFPELDRLLNARLDLKIASSDLVESVYRAGKRGVKLHPEPAPPRMFPGGDWIYWKLDRQSEAWTVVEQTLNLGIRFNEKQVTDPFDGEQSMKVRTLDGRLLSLSFALFAMPS